MEKNIIVYAYLGDAVYELYIRNKQIENSYEKVDILQKNKLKYVTAKAQANILNNLINNNILTDEEIDIVKRARNYKRSSHPKNTDIITYKLATGFEALLGYLYYHKQHQRLNEILESIEV